MRPAALRPQDSHKPCRPTDCYEGARDAESKKSRIAFRLQRVTQNSSDHQCDSDGDRKCDGESGHVDRSHEQEIGEIEECASDERVHDIRSVGRVDVVQKAGGIVARASHRESKHKRDQEDTDRIVPVEKLETIAFTPL